MMQTQLGQGGKIRSSQRLYKTQAAQHTQSPPFESKHERTQHTRIKLGCKHERTQHTRIKLGFLPTPMACFLSWFVVS